MHLSHVSIQNFRNFKELEVNLQRNVLIVGENRVGKSNFLHALRLVLDSNLPDSARRLKSSDLWDGRSLREAPITKITLQFVEFEDDPAIDALLCDYITSADPGTSQVTYLWRPKSSLERPAASFGDYEYIIYGGDDETMVVSSELRRRLCLEMLPALRDAEQELGSWRSSPLRPGLERAIDEIPVDQLASAAAGITSATQRLTEFEPIRRVEIELGDSIRQLAKNRQDLKPKLGFTASDPGKVLRSLGLYIDDGKRAISEASVGSANLALIGLRMREFDSQLAQNERNFSFICIEEPEAHLHPHLQRSVFSHLMKTSKQDRAIVLTTHSPHVASVAPLKSIVILREEKGSGTKAFSSAHLDISNEAREDIERYLDATRAEILFSRGVIFVEGDAEATLMPAFAQAIGMDLDELGLSVCNVSGTHFSAYVTFALALGMPYVVITDWDPILDKKTGKQRVPLGVDRAIKLTQADYLDKVGIDIAAPQLQDLKKDHDHLRKRAQEANIFMNQSTLEVELMNGPLRLNLIAVLQLAPWGKRRMARLKKWLDPTCRVDSKELLNMISDVGKGRFSGRLKALGTVLDPPEYIRLALQCLEKRVKD